MKSKYVVVDLETTGNSAKKGDKIIQFAAVVIENDQIVDQFSSLLCPGKPIPIFIEELTGLTDEMVKGAPLFAEIAPKVIEMLDGACFVAHNVLFDLSFLQEELIMAGFEGFYGSVLDTVEMARILFPSSDSYKLSDLATQEGVNHERPHQADSDAYATGELLLILFARLRELPFKTIKKLYKLSDGLKGDLNEVLEELLKDKERKIEELSLQLEEYHGVYIKKSQENDQLEESQEIAYPTDEKDKEQLLSNAYTNYEKRSGQFRMMDIVHRSFQNEHHAMIEAGTGVGKSLAYLLPAVYTAVSNNEPVVISTYTTQLQEQLLQKDIPILKRAVQFPFTTVLMKGKSHYISLDKFVHSLRETDDNYDTILTKMQILVWLTETTTGDRDELNLSSGGQLFWHKIKHDENTFGRDFSSREHDYYLKTRNDGKKADLIITNHSLLLSDLVADRPILPPSDYIIIDEGHHFEKVAGQYFGSKIDYATTRFLLQKMGIYEQKQLAYKLEKELEEKGVNGIDLSDSFQLNGLMGELLVEMDELFKTIALIAKKKVKNKSQSRIKCSLAFDMTKELKALKAVAERFLFLLTDYRKAITIRYEFLLDKMDKNSNKQQTVMSDVASWLEDVEKIVGSIRRVLLQPETEDVSWIEIDTRVWQNKTTVYSQPVSISTQLNDRLFQQKKSVVLTSATLSVKGSFQYTMNSLGLQTATCYFEQIPSPFHYDQQVQLVISNDLPEINTVSLQDYIAEIGEHIISIAEATKGRLLILFTSYDMLRRTYELIKESGFLQDYSLLAQGITGGSRTRLVRNFQRFEKAILLGTSSFWEGIDIPGEDLSCLVMVRLPFSPPDEPLTEEKCLEIKKSGGNPFYDYSLPEAVIRFKQGFGRLIRTKNDKGVMIIFDRRIVSTQYGKVFLESLPTIHVKEMNIDKTVDLINKWL
ncbi:ATP-dependent DNA helicase DinG [Bacillus sp. V3B]|uniref:ATP-dependent DNA helicase DinG n=1 Tax=Bacillus sp. V3B TaxID=2804915 RepID=UPI00210CC664|nr:ATP-dependent DNA helicase DinG [Bacillus sp. V3B]MCQ6273906.1 ATP-dependent DNA helicase DinG [Bacillus sp. V3B]